MVAEIDQLRVDSPANRLTLCLHICVCVLCACEVQTRGVYTRTLLRKTNQNLPFIREKSYCLGCSFTLIRQRAMKTAISNTVTKAYTLKTVPLHTFRFSRVHAKKMVRNRHDSYSARDFLLCLA